MSTHPHTISSFGYTHVLRTACTYNHMHVMFCSGEGGVRVVIGAAVACHLLEAVYVFWLTSKERMPMAQRL